MDLPLSLPEPGADCRVTRVEYPVRLETPRLLLSQPVEDDVPRLLRFMEDNREHFRATIPISTYDETIMRGLVIELREAWERREMIRFFITHRDDPEGPIVGMRAFTRIREGMDRSCTMSGAIDREHLRRGYSSEAARAGIAFCYGVLGLHRIDAEHRADHEAVPGVMGKLGFHRIGLAPAYRWTDGAWRDHILYCHINPNAPDPTASTEAAERRARLAGEGERG